MLIKQEDGSELEVFTPDEVEAQRLAAIEEFKLENPDKTDELETMRKEKAQIEEELKKLSNKDQNFESLRKAKNEAEGKLKEITSEIDTKISSVRKEVIETLNQNHYRETLQALTDGDDELKKKVEHHYKRLGDIASTKEEMDAKLRDAWLLATKTEPTDAFNTSVLSTGGTGKIKFNSKSKNISPEEKAVAGKLGLSEADMKKYG